MMDHHIFLKFAAIANQNRDHVAFKQIINNVVINTSYAQLLEQIDLLKPQLMALISSKGQRVALMGTSSPCWIASYLACLSLEMTVVCIDPALPSEQVRQLLIESQSQILLTEQKIFSGLSLDVYQQIVVLDINHHLATLFYPTHAANTTADGFDPNIASILFTSGTSDAFKGVILEHKAMLAAIHSSIMIAACRDNDNILCLLPAHHIYALICVILSPLLTGASITFIEKLDGEHIVQAMQLGKPSIIVGVPRIYELLANSILGTILQKPLHKRQLILTLLKVSTYLKVKHNVNLGKSLFSQVHKKFGGHIRLLSSGGASLPLECFYLLNGLGFTIIEGYGLTETSASVITNPMAKQKPGSVGIPLPGVQIKIAGKDAQGIGEICVQTPSLMRSYLNDPTTTQAAIKEGWFHTGDLGSMDKEGYISIKGRIKELIILTNGKKLSPTTLENYLTGIEGVADFAVVGINNPQSLGENIHLAIVIDPKWLQDHDSAHCEYQIKDNIHKRLSKAPSWYQPQRIHFIDKIPRTNTLKAKRKQLAQQILAQETFHLSQSEPIAATENLLEAELLQLIITLMPTLSTQQLKADSSFQYDAGFDSISMNELLSLIQAKYQISIDREKLVSVFRIKDLTLLIQEQLKQSSCSVNTQNITLENQEQEYIQRFFKKHILAKPLSNFIQNKISTLIQFLLHKRIQISYLGLENLDPQKTYLIVANHTSHLDNLILNFALHKKGMQAVAAAAKDYFFDQRLNFSIVKWLIKMIPFERNFDNLALQRNLYYAQLCKNHHFSLIIFPEGTRSMSGKMNAFKNGVALFADQLEMDILPVHIEGAYQCLPKGKFFPKRGSIQVKFGKPMQIKKYFDSQARQLNSKNYQEFMDALKAQISQMKEPVT